LKVPETSMLNLLSRIGTKSESGWFCCITVSATTSNDHS
jgi:hypothetical protein